MLDPVLRLHLGDDGAPGATEQGAGVQARVNFGVPTTDGYLQILSHSLVINSPEQVRGERRVVLGGLLGHGGVGPQGPLGGVGPDQDGHLGIEDLQHDTRSENNITLCSC